MKTAFFRMSIGILVVLASVAAHGQVRPASAVHRTILVVADIEKSVAFYEGLGLSKMSDDVRNGASEIFGAADLPLTADSTRSRVVVLGSGETGGQIVLLWYDRPPLASARSNLMGLGTGDMILSVTVEDLQMAYGRLDAIGARIHRPPNRLTVAGSGSGSNMYAYDPDGHMVEIRQGVP